MLISSPYFTFVVLPKYLYLAPMKMPLHLSSKLINQPSISDERVIPKYACNNECVEGFFTDVVRDNNLRVNIRI